MEDRSPGEEVNDVLQYDDGEEDRASEQETHRRRLDNRPLGFG